MLASYKPVSHFKTRGVESGLFVVDERRFILFSREIQPYDKQKKSLQSRNGQLKGRLFYHLDFYSKDSVHPIIITVLLE